MAPHDGESALQTRPATRGEARRQAFLEAATDVFLEQGFEAASVNEVVRRAGGSLATLYSQFRNKDGLFLAVIEETTARFAAGMLAAIDQSIPLEKGLQEIGEQFVISLLQPRSLAFFRIMVGEGRKFPDLMTRFVEVGPERVRAAVAEYILARGPQENVHLTPAEADLAGSYYCEMLRAKHQYRALSDDTYMLSEEEIAAHVRYAVRFLLDGLRSR